MSGLLEPSIHVCAGPGPQPSARPPATTVPLSVAMAVGERTRGEALLTSLVALAAAIDVAERAGSDVEVVIADATGDPAITALLAGIEGASVIDLPGASVAQAWAAAYGRTSAAAVLVIQADSAIDEHALQRLADALGAEPAAAAAVPYPEPGAYALVRRDVLRADDSVAALVERLRSEGAAVTAAAGAGAVRRYARSVVSSDQWSGVRVPPWGRLTAGEGSYADAGTVFMTYSPGERIDLGAYCSVGAEARFVNGGGRQWAADGTPLELLVRGAHRFETATTFPIGVLVGDAPYDQIPPDAIGEPQVIGDDALIGYGATIFGPVTVGVGAIVGACALVRSNVEPYSIVAGVPAREIRKRFRDTIIERLLRIGWWEWPPELVRTNWWWFTRPVEDFVRQFDPGAPER